MALPLTRLPGRLFWFGCVFLACSSGWGSTNSIWSTRVWQTDDGLPDNQVTAILQGPDGYLWVGTAVGLARFDGFHFTDFSYSNGSNNEDQGVSALLPARDGGLWVRSRRGVVFKLSRDFSQAGPAATNLPESRTLAVAEDQNDRLWVVSPDQLWQAKDGKAVHLSSHKTKVPIGTPNGLVVDQQNNVWLAKGYSVGIFRHGIFQIITTTPYKPHLAAARTNGVWIATGKQLFKCDDQGRFEDFGAIPASIHAGANVLMEASDGTVWVGTTSDGLFRRNQQDFEKVPTSHPDILSLAEDLEGNIWVGTAGGGLDRISTRGMHLEGLETDSSLVAIQSVCEDTNGVLWGATQNGLLVSRMNGQWSLALTNLPLSEPVNCVATDRKGALWIGTRERRLYRWSGGRLASWGDTEGLAGRAVLALLPTSTGDLWLAGNGPTFLERLHNDQLISYAIPKAIGRITALAEDRTGNIWIGSEAGDLMRVAGDYLVDERTLMGFSRRTILCLYPTSDGALWIGYGAAGLGRLQDGHFSRLGAGQGLFDEYISQMVADDEGWFWFGSERGIFKVRRVDLEKALDGRVDRVQSISYGRNEGLFSVEADSADISPFVSSSALRSHDGRIWILLRKALAVVDPKRLRDRVRPPPVLVSQVVMDGQTIASYGGTYGDIRRAQPVANLMAPGGSLPLPPSHRHLQFNFTAINLSAPEEIRFRYQLVGFDNGWIDAGKERTADYSRLTYGQYQFRVEAANGDGPWSETPATLGFTVRPFFWQTWWFRIGALLLFTSSVIAIVRYISFRRFQAEMSLVEQRAALDKERTRIARDLHDDLGCSLNKVALTLDMAQRGLERPEALSGEIQHCSAMVRQVAKSVDEIVWAINPRNDTLRYMVDYISQFAVEFLHAAGIACRVDLPDNLPNHLISPEARHNLFLVVKEALNNIAQHARAGEVHFRVTATGHQVAIEIEDNGRGFESAPDNAFCDGLRNMRQRMEEIGGRFELETRPAASTRVAFIYAWSANGESKGGNPGEALGNPNMPYPLAAASRK